MLEQLNRNARPRNPHSNTDVKTVLEAVATTVHWMSAHPDCTAAAWIASGVATKADHCSQGKGDLYDKACAIMRDPE